MGVFFRKSINLGPIRLNLSTKGVGVSTGVKGARLSMGPNGTFVHLGRHGLYYRKKIGGKNRIKNKRKQTTQPSYSTSAKLIGTTNFDDITDVESEEFVQELSEKENKIWLFKWFGLLPLLTSLIFALPYFSVNKNLHYEVGMFKVKSTGANVRSSPSTDGNVIKVVDQNDLYEILEKKDKWTKIKIKEQIKGYISNTTGTTGKVKRIKSEKGFGWPETLTCLTIGFIWFSLILLTIYLYWLDLQRKTVEIEYSMEDEFIDFYEKQLNNFDKVRSIRRIWQITSKAKSKNIKYTSGASSLVDKKVIRTFSVDSLPTQLIKTNIQIPHIGLSNIDLYFFPERLILKKGKKYASLYYMNLDIERNDVRFQVDGRVPTDSKIIDHTWYRVNKGGGPDRRFKGNYEIPVCLFTQYHLDCDYGINEIIMTSKLGGMDEVFDFIEQIGNIQRSYFHGISNN